MKTVFRSMNLTIHAAAALAVALTMPIVHASAGADPVTVTKISTPEKALKFEVEVPAPLDDVWKAFTTKEGLQTWLWSDCTVELKNGGDWLATFPGTTGGGTIKSFTPKRELVVSALAPEQFPAVRDARTNAAFTFEAVSATSTRVTLMQTGWKTGGEWDAAYNYLASGNAQLMLQLYTRFTKGPIDWKK